MLPLHLHPSFQRIRCKFWCFSFHGEWLLKVIYKISYSFVLQIVLNNEMLLDIISASRGARVQMCDCKHDRLRVRFSLNAKR